MNEEKRRQVALALGELIEALDRRVPHVERLGEGQIAREAAVLRQQAAARLEELRTSELDLQRREDELSDAVMSDDGGAGGDRAEERRSRGISEERG